LEQKQTKETKIQVELQVCDHSSVGMFLNVEQPGVKVVGIVRGGRVALPAAGWIVGKIVGGH